MISVNSKNNRLIRLTDERIKHIFNNHPEISNALPWVIETIKDPDKILLGDFNELLAIKRYPKTPVTFDKYLTVVYKETNDFDGFILTAYFCRKVNNKRKTLWQP